MFQKVGVVGCGLMGSGIAEVCARAGLETVVREVSEEALERGLTTVRASISRAVGRNKIAAEEADLALAALHGTTSWRELADCDLVIEAAIEDVDTKRSIFQHLDEVVKPTAILASNTSSIPIMKLAIETRRPSQVLGLHFFNPVPIMSLVEVVRSLTTDDKVMAAADDFVRQQLGKTVINSTDRAGFIVNSLLIPYILSAARMMESGFASKADIDIGMVEGCRHPMGPLALADLIGLDTVVAVAESLYGEFKEPLYAAPPLLSRMVEAGLLGRKTGRGFYSY